MYIKDLTSGKVREYGADNHDALRVSHDGRTLSYANLQNGDGSRYGDYRFCDKDGLIPEEDKVLIKHGADAYFNIGGWNNTRVILDKIRAEIVDELDHLKNYRDKDMAVYCRMTACKKHIAIIDKYRNEEG